MSAAAQERLERRRMSLEEFRALPDEVRAEYVDGEAIVSPPADMPHNEIGLRLIFLLRAALPGRHVGYEIGLRLTPTKWRIPDVAVLDRIEPVSWTDQVPLLVVEVLSPSTRREDMLRKSGEYQRAGVGQYWLVDREARSLTILRNNNDGWDIALELDDDHPTGSVDVGDHGIVDLGLNALLDF